jgi:hypothetical protein
MTKEGHFIFASAKDYELVKKAAKSEGRSMNNFITRAALDAAKASLAMLKLPTYAPQGDQEASA